VDRTSDLGFAYQTSWTTPNFKGSVVDSAGSICLKRLAVCAANWAIPISWPTSSLRADRTAYRIAGPYIRPVSNLEPRFNFAPMQRGIVVRLDKEGRRDLVMMRWGLVPSWSKDDTAGAAMINAKAETVAEKPALPRGVQGATMLGGCWRLLRVEGGRAEGEAAPNALCAPIHNRMPVILAPDDWPGWLGAPDDRKTLLRTFPAERMERWPVGKAVGNARNEGQQLIARIDLAEFEGRASSYRQP
jgi:putative SOS response-associated peptidase YedK